MATNNYVHLRGYLGAAPKIVFNDNNEPIYADFTMYVDASYYDKKNDEFVEAVEKLIVRTYNYYKLEDFKKKPEIWNTGAHVEINGSIRKYVWDSKDRKNADGSPAKDSRMLPIASHVVLISKPNTSKSPEDLAASDIPAESRSASGRFNDMDDDIPF